MNRNRCACIFVALGLAGAGSTALAAEPASQPVMMSDAQMDNVTGGGLINVIGENNLNNLQVNVNAVVNAIVNANVLVYAPINVNVLTGLTL